MNYRTFISWRGLALLVFATIGLILLMAMPSEEASIGTFALVIIATKAGAFLSFYIFAAIVKQMEREGEITIDE